MNFGRAATLGDRGLEFSVRADRRVRVLGAPRPWASEGSSFPCWAPGGFKFWVHRESGRQRVRVFHTVAQKIPSEFFYIFLFPVQELKRHLERVSGTADFGLAARKGRRVAILGAPRPWTLEGSSFPCQAPEWFEFWVHRDPVRQRVRVFRTDAWKILGGFSPEKKNHLERISGTPDFGYPQG